MQNKNDFDVMIGQLSDETSVDIVARRRADKDFWRDYSTMATREICIIESCFILSAILTDENFIIL